MIDEKKAAAGSTPNIEWTPELEDAVIAGVADKNQNLRALGKELGISPAAIIRRTRSNAEFGKLYELAMEIRAELDFDQLDDLLAESAPEVEGRTDTGWVQHLRVRIDTIKWMIGKRFASKYGEKVQHSGELTITEKRVISDI